MNLLVIYNPWNTEFWMQKSGKWGGSCFGFAVSCFLAFDDINAFLKKFPLVSQFNNLNELLLNDITRKCINQIWTSAWSKDYQSFRTKNMKNTQVQTLNELKNMIINVYSDHRTISIWNQHGKSGGHTMNPYMIEKSKDNPDTTYIYVYDNNHSGDATRKIVINTKSNFWYYIIGDHQEGNELKNDIFSGEKGIYLDEPVSIVKDYYALKNISMTNKIFGEGDNYLEIYNTDNVSMLITNSDGYTIGCKDGVVFNNFIDGTPIIPSTGNFHPPIGYYIPKGNYSVQMKEFADSLSNFAAFYDSTFFAYNRSDALSSQTDKFNIGNDTFKVYNPDNNSKDISLKTILKNEVNVKVFGLSKLAVSKNDSISLSVSDREKLKVNNYGSEKTYDLRVELASNTGNPIYEHNNITIPSQSSQTIIPVWNDLKKQDMQIQIDNNFDGKIDDTLNLENQYVDTPPTGSILKKSNIYIYPNPFNPDKEVGTIRYSLSKPGDVTIKIFDVSNTLVRKLLDHASRSSGTEYSEAWNGRNDNGRIVSNGVYFFVIESSSGERAIGKAVVLR